MSPLPENTGNFLLGDPFHRCGSGNEPGSEKASPFLEIGSLGTRVEVVGCLTEEFEDFDRSRTFFHELPADGFFLAFARLDSSAGEIIASWSGDGRHCASAIENNRVRAGTDDIVYARHFGSEARNEIRRGSVTRDGVRVQKFTANGNWIVHSEAVQHPGNYF